MTQFRSRCAVIAFGGNAISHPDRFETIYDQFRNTRRSLTGMMAMLRAGYNLAITHGNAPQVGAALRRVEKAADEMPTVPLGVLVADTQGSMGYMIEQSLQNRLNREGIYRSVVTIITQVLVDEHDPALSNPTKYVGQIYPRTEAERLMKELKWTMKPFGDEEHWRRVVGSPIPLGIVNRMAIRELIQEGVIVIAGGGGGIPVYRHPELGLEGVDAVIDKDRVASILAHDIEAHELYILTNVDCAKLDFGKPGERDIPKMTVSEAKRWLQEGQFPAGSMGPKVEAAVQFIQGGGERAIICALDKVKEAVAGSSGTTITT